MTTIQHIAGTRRSIVVTMLTLCVASTGIGQTVRENFAAYRNEAMIEKIYLHTDRDVYVAGETLWLKAYTVDGSYHRPSDVSKVAYLELLDQNNGAVLQSKIKLSQGLGSASIFLPASLNSGNYVLRAYTRWMKNFDHGYFFEKKITLINSFVRLEPTARKTGQEHVATFFPEGGNWIAGVQARVAFKVCDKAGLGLEFRGSLVNERNDTVLHFKPGQFGMGYFELQPSAGSSYRAVIQMGAAVKTWPLPEVAASGYSMRLTSDNETVKVEVTQAGVTGASVTLFTHARNILSKIIDQPVRSGKAVFEIAARDLPEGITHFTVFDDARQPVCERLFFRLPTQRMPIDVALNQENFPARTKVSMTLKAQPGSELSMAVYRRDTLTKSQPGQIFEYLWLASDLRGFIESPSFYTQDTPESTAAADVLMMTQGWRRFAWKDVLTDKRFFEFTPEYHGHIVRGTVKSRSGEPVPITLTYLSGPGKVIDVYGSRSDKNGRVIYEMRNFYGPRKVITYADSTLHVELDNPFSTAPAVRPLESIYVTPSAEADLTIRSVGMQVQNIYFDEPFETVRYDSSSFYGQPDETYILDDYTRFPVMEEVLREYVPGVMVRKQKDGFHLFLLDVVNKRAIKDQPMILLDGVPIFDVDKVMAFDPLKVRKLEVQTRRFFHGTLVLNGVLSMTTYDGDMGGYELDANYVSVDYDGLHMQRQFYSPNYEKQKTVHLPDQRSLLYWNPEVTIGSAGAVIVEFHTSDIPGNYEVLIEGITKDGKAGSASSRLKINKD